MFFKCFVDIVIASNIHIVNVNMHCYLPYSLPAFSFPCEYHSMLKAKFVINMTETRKFFVQPNYIVFPQFIDIILV